MTPSSIDTSFTTDIIDWTQNEYTDTFSYVVAITVSCGSESHVAATEPLQVASDRLEQCKVENCFKIQPHNVCWMLASKQRELFTSYKGGHVQHKTGGAGLERVINCRLTMVKNLENDITKAK